MADKVKFGFILDEVHVFDEKYLKKIDESHLDDADKFIQVKINGKEYIRVGNYSHGSIFVSTLCEFGLGFKFNTRYNNKNYRIPLEKGENYELIDAGKIRFLGDKLNFYDASPDYINCIKGTDRKKNLEEIFGKDKVREMENVGGLPSFLVEFKGD